MLYIVLNDKSVAGFIGLVPALLYSDYILFIACTVCVAVLLIGEIFENEYFQGTVATSLMCGEICNKYFIANFLLNVAVKEFKKSVSIWRRYGQKHDSRCRVLLCYYRLAASANSWHFESFVDLIVLYC